MSALPQRRNQVEHLLRPTVKMASCFDMQYFHGPIILLESAMRAISCFARMAGSNKNNEL